MNKIITIVCASLLLIGCTEHPGLQKTLGDTWRLVDPEEAELGAWGIRTVVTPTKIKFDRHGYIENNNTEVDISQPLIVQYKSIQAAKMELDQNQIGNLGITYQDAVDTGFTVIKTLVSNKEEAFKTRINNEIQSNNEQKWNADSIRIITGITTVTNHNNTQEHNFSFNGNITGVQKFDGRIIASTSNGEQIISKRGDGSIVAYQYSRLCWNQDGEVLYIQEEVPNYWLFGWLNSFDCPAKSFEKRPISKI